MMKFFTIVKRITTFYITLKAVIPLIWKLAKFEWIHWHFSYGFDKEDYAIVWKELHKAHKIYATKLNLKYHAKLYDAGPDREKPVVN